MDMIGWLVAFVILIGIEAVSRLKFCSPPLRMTG